MIFGMTIFVVNTKFPESKTGSHKGPDGRGISTDPSLITATAKCSVTVSRLRRYEDVTFRDCHSAVAAVQRSVGEEIWTVSGLVLLPQLLFDQACEL